MTSYIKSELYRLFHSKGGYLFIAICSLLLISANIVLAAVGHSDESFRYANTYFSLSLLYSDLPIVFILCVSVVSIVFGNEHNNHTLKNSISYGITRGSIYFGKLVVELVYAFVAFLIIVGLDIASSYLLLENSGPGNLELLMKAFLVALPLLFFAIATSNCFIFILESTGGAITAILLLLVAFPTVSGYLGLKFEFFATLTKILPWNMMNSIGFDYDALKLILPWEGSEGYYNYWFYGIVQMVLFVLIGYFVFRKKEIK